MCEREETILMNKSKEKMKLLCHNGIAQIFSTMKIGLRKLKEMKDHASESEYGRVKLKMPDGKFHSLYVHRLVGQFIPNHSHKEEINHKNLDKSNNNINNLEWVSHIENIKHYHKNKKGIKI